MKEEVIKQKIIENIESQRKDIIRFARELVRTPSTNPYTPEISSRKNDPIEKEVAKLLYDKLRKFGLHPRFVSALSERPNVVCSLKKKGRPTLIFNGHMDTVPVGDEKHWQFPPFAARIVGGKIYGRGAYDMKSSLAAMVYAIGSLVGLKEKLRGNVVVSFVVDEEPGAFSEIGTKFLLKKGLGGDACIVGEPGLQKICIGTKGGYRLKLIAEGESISTGASAWERKERGVNAVIKMAKCLLGLERLKLKYNPVRLFAKRRPVITPGTIIKGGSGINIVPDYCEATVDIRLLPGQTKENVKGEILNYIKELNQKDPQVKIRVQDLMFVPSVFISKDEKIVRDLKKSCKLILGKEPSVGVSGAWCDSHFFIRKGIPTICGFGPDGRNFHGANEFVYTETIIQATKIYALTAYEFIKK